MSNPLFELYVEAGNPLSEMDIDSVNQWAVDRINYLMERYFKLEKIHDAAIDRHYEEIKRLVMIDQEE